MAYWEIRQTNGRFFAITQHFSKHDNLMTKGKHDWHLVKVTEHYAH